MSILKKFTYFKHPELRHVSGLYGCSFLIIANNTETVIDVLRE